MFSQEIISCDLDLAAKVVYTAIDYAKGIGFNPHKDSRSALKFFHDAHPENCDEEIPTGKDGMPFFVNGPYDNVEKVFRTLNRTVGEGNYHFLAIMDDPMKWDDFNILDDE